MTLFAIIALAPAPSGAGQAVLREVKVTGGSEPTVEISADGPLTFNADLMPTLLRGVVDLPGTEPGPVPPVLSVGSGMIARVTVQKKMLGDRPVTRLVVHLQQPALMTVAAAPADPTRLLISLKKSAAPAAAPGKTVKPTAPPAVAGAAQPAPSPPPAGGAVVDGIAVTGKGIAVSADRPIRDFRAFTLKNPERLVIDIPGGKTSLKNVSLPANGWGVIAARAGVSEGRLRLVFDRKEPPLPQHSVTTSETGLLIAFSPVSGR